MECIDIVLFWCRWIASWFYILFWFFFPWVLEFDINVTHWFSSSVDQRLERSQAGQPHGILLFGWNSEIFVPTVWPRQLHSQRWLRLWCCDHPLWRMHLECWGVHLQHWSSSHRPCSTALLQEAERRAVGSGRLNEGVLLASEKQEIPLKADFWLWWRGMCKRPPRCIFRWKEKKL